MVEAVAVVLEAVLVLGLANMLLAPAVIMAAAAEAVDLAIREELALVAQSVSFGLADHVARHRSPQPTSDLNLEHEHGTR